MASYAFELQPDECRSIYVTVKCDRGVEESHPLPFRKGLRAAFNEHKTASRGMATISTSNQIFNEVLCRSMADLAMLTTGTPQGPYPYAGIPWYSTTFGRDGIITALQMLWCDPASPKACCGGSPRIRPANSIRSPTPSPEKSCTRCAAARWRRCARFRSVCITAASMRRRCS